MTDQADGLLVPGNIDLNNRPRVKNPDGSISTVRSIGVNVDGKEVLIPTVVGDRVVSNADAVKEYKRTGQHLGIFDTPAHSDAYAQQLHEDQAALITKPMADEAQDGPTKGWKWADAPSTAVAGEPHMSASAPFSALPPNQSELQLSTSPETYKKLSDPLIRPTGVDAIDSLTSPINLALGAMMGAGPAMRLVKGAVAGLTDRVGSVAAGKLLKLVTPSLLKKPAELVDLLSELGKGPEAPPAAPPAPAAPPSAPAGAPSPPPASPMAAAPVAQPAPAGPVAAAPEVRVPAQPLAADSTLSPQAVADRLAAKAAPVAARPDLPKELIEANKLGTTPKALNELALAARRAKITLSPADYQAGLRLMKEGGVSADTAIGTLTQQRIAPAAAPEVPKLTAAEMVQAQKWKAAGATDDQIMQRVQLSRALTSATGTPTPEVAAAAMRTLKATKYKQ